MDGEFPSESSVSICTPANLSVDNHSEVNELPRIMASLGLDENSAAPLNESVVTTSSSPSSFKLRRSQRKQAVPRISLGGVTKRRCILKKTSKDVCLQESDNKIREFYETYNKKYKRQETRSLETIYEEPKEKNGTLLLSGRKQRRFLAFTDMASKAKLKRRQSKIRLLLLEKERKFDKKHFTIEEVKEHLAQSELVSLPSQ